MRRRQPLSVRRGWHVEVLVGAPCKISAAAQVSGAQDIQYVQRGMKEKRERVSEGDDFVVVGGGLIS